MIIGITGRIGSGKSEVSRIFQRAGWTLIDVDKMGHRLLLQDNIKRGIRETFGEKPFKDSEIDRKRVGKIVFRDRERLSLFNSIVHPPLIKELTALIKRQPRTSLVVVDCALIFKWEIEELFDHIVLIKADEEKILKRMTKAERDVEDVRRILSLQIDKERDGDFVIENNGSLSKLKKKAEEICLIITELQPAQASIL